MAGEVEREAVVANGARDRRAAFVDFYEDAGDRVMRALAVTLGDQDLARDAAQEAMARAWRSWEQVGGYANPAGWVYRVGLNWARSRLRRLAREVLGRVRDRAVSQPDVPDPVVWEALMGLPVSHRAVVVLRLLLDWSVAEVAEALAIPQARSGAVNTTP